MSRHLIALSAGSRDEAEGAGCKLSGYYDVLYTYIDVILFCAEERTSQLPDYCRSQAEDMRRLELLLIIEFVI